MADKDELGIMEDFEWALKDPTDEKLRELGQVISTVTLKLAEVIGELQNTVSDLQSKLGGLEARVGQLDSRMAGIRTAGPSGAGEAGSVAGSKGIAGKAPTPARAPGAAAPGGGGTLMGELKSLLSARRKKGDSGGGEGPG
ncbi:MAG: hypothetical protein C4K47_00240 [Candidatus Thorarchaeota archaeon]|nr:MAG: hypothetical protein C4K47_00240 [Candidatus Thorarchaeota archaeon]